ALVTVPPQNAPQSLLFYTLGNPMGAEDRMRIGRHIFELLHELHPFGLQGLNDVLVVNDFVPHVDRWPVAFKRALDDFNCAHHSGAETARLGQNHFHQAPLRIVLVLSGPHRARPRHARSVTASCMSLPNTWSTFATIPLASRPA